MPASRLSLALANTRPETDWQPGLTAHGPLQRLPVPALPSAAVLLRSQAGRTAAERVEDLLDGGALLRRPDRQSLERLGAKDGLGKGAGEGDLAARGGGEGDEEERAEGKDGESDLQLLERELVLPAVVQKGELHREEDGQDGLQQPRHHAGVVEVLGDQLASREAKLGRRVEAADDDVRGEAREALHRRRASQAPVAVPLQRPLDLAAAREGRELLRDDERILERLAAALAEVGHHRVDGVPEQRDAALVPRLEHRGRAVVQVALLDLVLLRRSQDVVDLRRPPLKQLLQVRRGAVRLLLARLGVGRPREEGVPLVAAAPDVGDDKVLLRPDVHLVAALGVASPVLQLARKDGVARVGDAGPLAARGRLRHRRAHVGPDAVGPDEDVAVHLLARLQRGDDAAVAALPVGLDAGAEPQVVARAPHQDLLQLRPLDHASEGHLARLGGRPEVELCVPLVADAVLDAVGPVAGPRRARLDLLVQLLVDRAEALHRV
mmetsp:Transcript_37550/g.120362  ORF Transcript_37550/g.120362 Transcript_37550/m.120362 type:complete len:494 (+) Transcript_37550:294-1775(+)